MAKTFEYLIPYIVNNQYYYKKDGKIIDLDELLNDNFLYKKNKSEYLWQKK